MILMIGVLCFESAQWIAKKFRQSKYSKMLRPYVGRASIVVQHLHKFNPLPLSSNPLYSSNINHLRQSEDDVVSIGIIEPTRIVNLDSWSAYSAVSTSSENNNFYDDILLLVQAAKHKITSQELTFSEDDIPTRYKLHIFQNNVPVAWKFDNLYEVILRTTLYELVNIVDAFNNGMLTMGDDLDICTLMTIKNTGTPFTPSRSQHQAFSFSKSGSFNSISDNDDKREVKSSLKDAAGIGQEIERKDQKKENQAKDEIDMSCNSLSERSSTLTSSCKPPNILLYTGRNETDNNYQELKKLIEQCINREAYTIYHLKPEQLLTTPWMDNVALLVCCCDDASETKVDALMNFYKKGGNILSFNSGLFKGLLYIKKTSSRDKLIKFDYKNWNEIYTMSTGWCIDTKSQVDNKTALRALGRNSDNKEVLIAMLESENSKVVIVEAHLNKDLIDMSTDSTDFAALKSSNQNRLHVIEDLLKLLEMNCSPSSNIDLTPAYLLASSSQLKRSFLECIIGKMKGGCLNCKDITMQFHENDEEVDIPTDVHLPVLTSPSNSQLKYFNETKYWENLTSKYLGQILIYVDVVPTTMALFDGFKLCVPKSIGVIAIAGRQTAGRGRGGNSWLSPIGCAMFSLHVQINTDSELGGKITFLQHIMSLAVVKSICTLPGCDQLPLKLKWPNDIYYGNSIKLGGVVVNCSVMSSTIHAIIGCGFNVSNSNPTICINDIIRHYNKEHSTTIPICSCEQLIARTVTMTEELLDLFQTKGHQAFCDLYYKSWIHSDQRVQVESLDFETVTVSGLDEFGFLSVKKTDGSVISLQPDGNSFDIMHNLIAIKKK